VKRRREGGEEGKERRERRERRGDQDKVHRNQKEIPEK
jgi:hypothetical protein